MLAAGFWLGLGIGLVSGACLGVVVAALMAAAAHADRTSETIYQALPDQDVPDLGIEHRDPKDEDPSPP